MSCNYFLNSTGEILVRFGSNLTWHYLYISYGVSRTESVVLEVGTSNLSKYIMDGCAPVVYSDTCSFAVIFYVFIDDYLKICGFACKFQAIGI